MTNCPQSIQELWSKIERERIRIPAEVWSEWDREFNVLTDIEMIVRRCQMDPLSGMPPSEAKRVGILAGLLQAFVHGIRRSPTTESYLDQGTVVVEQTVKDLVAHYVGNDLYKIALIVDVYGPHPEPVPPEDAGKILQAVDSIRDFSIRLRNATR